MKIKATYIAIILFIALVSALVYFAIMPAFRDIKKQSDVIADYQKESSAIVMQSQKIEDFKIKYANGAYNFDDIASDFINTADPVYFIEFLEESAESYEVGLGVNIQSDQKRPEDSFKTASFQVALTGSFSGIMRFLTKVENGKYLVKVDNLSMNKFSSQGQNGADEQNLNVNLNLQVLSI